MKKLREVFSEAARAVNEPPGFWEKGLTCLFFLVFLLHWWLG